MKITVEAERKIIPPGNFFKTRFLIILRHNLAENRETGTCKCYVASDPVLKSLTPAAKDAMSTEKRQGSMDLDLGPLAR